MPLLDSLGRDHQYLRISITEACNLRCIYCKPTEDTKLATVSPCTTKDRPHTMSYTDCLQIVSLAARFGFRKVRITGGEPLLHPEIAKIVKGISTLSGVEDVSLTTNGTFLVDRIQELAQAGLRRINISLDSLNTETYTRITGQGFLSRVLEGIEACLQAGLHPVKLNVVLLKGINENEIPDFLALAHQWPVHVRFIECMPFLSSTADFYIPTDRVKQQAREAGFPLVPVLERSDLDGPAELYRIPGAKGLVGLIHPMSHHFCGQCNRVRVTSQGSLRPCLIRDHEIPLGNALLDPQMAYQVFRKALLMKEPAHPLKRNGELEIGTGASEAEPQFLQPPLRVQPDRKLPERKMYAIGG
ncbi:MAG: GTP 3',8-cyclase MoaA [Spirochaetes bacterium]|nr:GTP 3',8-cyclase MoaA [Spirochaetota bacterium]